MRVFLAILVVGVLVTVAMAQFHAHDARNYIWQGTFSDGAKPADSLKLLNWNIERGLRLDAIRTALERERPHLCVFQEVDLNARRTGRRNVAEDLARRLRLNYVFGVEFEELGQGSRSSPAYHGQAVLSCWPILSPRILRFTEQSDYWMPRWYLPNWGIFQRREGGRMALVVELNVGTCKLVIYNAHLESNGSERRRLLQLEEILADADRYPPSTAIILAGDLNTKRRPSPLVSRVKQAGFRDAVGQESVGTTRRGERLDWIFVRGPLRFDNGKVHREIVASDHYPLSVHISLGRRASSPWLN